jgi:hypothetical protein
MRGQAFDTFKLMIAAVVAVAILGILLSILGNIKPPAGDPKSVANQLLRECAPTCGAKTSDVIRFHGVAGDKINAEEFTTGTGVDATSVSVACPDFLATTFTCTSAPNGALEFKKTVDINARLGVTCTSGACTLTVKKP